MRRPGRVRKIAGAALLILATVIGGAEIAAAQEPVDDTFSDEEIFGGTESIVAEGGNSEVDGAGSLLAAEPVKIGGKFSLTMESEGDTERAGTELFDSFTSSADFGVDLFVDARPSEDLRIFVKGRLAYPFENEGNAEIREAFADLVPADGVFVRAGKQTANWGVGYFFSPANLLNLNRIDPEDPDAELTGPVAFKAQIPVGTTNYYAYVILNERDDGESIAVAPKIEWIVGSAEIAVGGLYERDEPWAAMATASGAFGDLDVFAEFVLRGNEDKVFVEENSGLPFGISAETREGELFPQTTLGFVWIWEDDEDRLDLSLRGQYYYNGLGYVDPEVLEDNRDALNGLIASGVLEADDLVERGRHYGAAGLALSDILGSEFGAAVSWVGNLVDRSGRASATVSWGGLDHLEFSASYSRSYGEEGAEYAPGGPAGALTLKLSVTEATF